MKKPFNHDLFDPFINTLSEPNKDRLRKTVAKVMKQSGYGINDATATAIEAFKKDSLEVYKTSKESP